MALAGSTAGDRIREIRTRKLADSQKDFAERLRSRQGKSPHPVTISRWERNIVEPSFSYAKQIAELGQITVDELLNGNGSGGA